MDYTIVSQNLFSSLSHFSVSSLTEFSHHSFLSFALKAETPDLSGDSSIELTSHPIAFKWNEHCREVLLDIFNSDEVNDHLDTLLNPSNDNDLDINSLVNDFQWRSQPDNLVPLCKFKIIIIIHFFRNSLFSQSMNTRIFA